ncbi:uncharacterized protein LOC115624779 [Scaptodrosophila lebanonensis]|uniref:Uncharacterized protein LOC115624779 n=1 Tax=Drosophila lebanonensis TaxID=7225 RepID=A0A6J2TFG1_DROLE|nr:uncharacterized protein LOC115624779 [Scaptodrosophila lebanonensis]
MLRIEIHLLALGLLGYQVLGLEAAQSLQCYSCEGINCQRTTRLNATTTCSDQLDLCVTVYDGFAVRERGCLLHLSVESRAKCGNADAKECQKCSGSLCNDKGRVDFRCVQCKGSENAQCNTAASTLTPEPCEVPTSPNSYCYIRQTSDVDVQRGCSVKVKDQVDCLADSKCSLCLSEDGLGSGACNSYDLDLVRSGAAAPQILLSFVGVLAVVAIKFFN